MIRFIAFGDHRRGYRALPRLRRGAHEAGVAGAAGRAQRGASEILLYKPKTVLGRDEFADIPVFGDPDVAEKHAIITAEGKRHLIEDAGSIFGTHLNGAKITKRELLSDGDQLEIGKTKFLYRDKATARSSYMPPAAAVQIPTSPNVCPFCGAPKDANGNCDCTVGGQARAAARRTSARRSRIR